MYIACRSRSRAEAAIRNIKESASPTNEGEIKFLLVDLADLRTVKPAVAAFAAQEKKLDVLWNNAGIGGAPVGEKTHQGIEMITGVNIVGHFLLTKLLLPYLVSAAKTAPEGSVRVIMYGSPVIEGFAPTSGVPTTELDNPTTNQIRNYAISKTGNWFLAMEFDKRVRTEGIVCLGMNPGNLLTEIWGQGPLWGRVLLRPTMHPVVYGAYTALWTGLGEQVGLEDGGRYAVPWGKWGTCSRVDLVDAMKSEKDGGTGEAERLWRWCEKITEEYA